jgi:hypothetical protein
MTQAAARPGRGQLTLCELLRRYESVQIPIIQRDYAQGRDEQTELRTDFLVALKGALDRAP